MKELSRAQILVTLLDEEMSRGKKIALGIGAGAAALGGAYLAHKHGYHIPGLHSAPVHHGMGWKSKAAIALGTAAALGTAGYTAHRSGVAGDAIASAIGKAAKTAEKHGLTNVVPAGRIFKHAGRANAGELEGYGKVITGAAREFYRAHTGR